MAYSRSYQYETSPRKLKPDYEPIKRTYPKKSTARKLSKREEERKARAMHRKIIMYIAIGFIGLFIISYRYSLIDDTYKKLKQEESKLAVLEKETKQLEANIESDLNLSKIEEEAKTILGMQTLTAEQKIYVSLPKTDHVETSSKEVSKNNSSDNWFMEIINKIIKNFS